MTFAQSTTSTGLRRCSRTFGHAAANGGNSERSATSSTGTHAASADSPTPGRPRASRRPRRPPCRTPTRRGPRGARRSG
ncbi:hypothetical protein ACFQV2_27195 [Actinokineospora soli]|uniref:Uncharacterized protein n=1 Tax=Actinokineospora soli TaxID=1048753 RepID=A0ABW2TUY2_9PSEU